MSASGSASTSHHVRAKLAPQLSNDIRNWTPGGSGGRPAGTAAGRCSAVDPGSTTKRVALGFGSGAAELKTVVKGYLMTAQGPRALGSGEVEAGSGKMPGGAVPLVVTVATANPLGLFVAGAAKAYSEASGSETIEGAANARLTKSPKKLESQPRNRGKSSDAMVEERSMRNRASRRETAIDRRRLRQYMQQEWRNGRIFRIFGRGKR